MLNFRHLCIDDKAKHCADEHHFNAKNVSPKMCVLTIAGDNQGGFFSPWNARILVHSIVLMLSFHLATDPPTEPPVIYGPVIQGNTAGQILTDGDTLSCTVTGGKPLVQSVHFSCDGHPDWPDSRSLTSVTSTITIDPSSITEGPAECTCTAYWQPQPDLYTAKSRIRVMIEVVEGPHSPKHGEDAAISCGVIGAVAVIMIKWRRQYRRCNNPQPEADLDSNPSTELYRRCWKHCQPASRISELSLP